MSQKYQNGTDFRPDNPDQVDNPPRNPDKPTTSKEMVQQVKEVLTGEGERISERAPAVPFLVVFMSYFIVLIAIGVILFIMVEFFGWRG